VGDAGHLFAIMSVAKPFVFALVCEACGAEDVRQRLAVNATGLAFNSVAAVERGEGGRTNPMVNPGAIGATSLAPGDTAQAKWRFIQDGAVCHYALAVMATAGMYETSGDWLYDVGVPGKSGIGGGIVAVAPGKGGLGLCMTTSARCELPVCRRIPRPGVHSWPQC